MDAVAGLIEGLNYEYGVKNNTAFFHYCQIFIEANNENMGKHIRTNEAFVRFLAGAAFSSMVSSIVGFFFFVVFFVKTNSLISFLYFMLALVSLLVLWVILDNYKNQRHREVEIVWTSMYLILRGGVVHPHDISYDELRERITLT